MSQQQSQTCITSAPTQAQTHDKRHPSTQYKSEATKLYGSNGSSKGSCVCVCVCVELTGECLKCSFRLTRGGPYLRGVIGSTVGAYPRGTGSNPVEGNGHFFPSYRQLYLSSFSDTHTHTHTHTRKVRIATYGSHLMKSSSQMIFLLFHLSTQSPLHRQVNKLLLVVISHKDSFAIGLQHFRRHLGKKRPSVSLCVCSSRRFWKTF